MKILGLAIISLVLFAACGLGADSQNEALPSQTIAPTDTAPSPVIESYATEIPYRTSENRGDYGIIDVLWTYDPDSGFLSGFDRGLFVFPFWNYFDEIPLEEITNHNTEITPQIQYLIEKYTPAQPGYIIESFTITAPPRLWDYTFNQPHRSAVEGMYVTEFVPAGEYIPRDIIRTILVDWGARPHFVRTHQPVAEFLFTELDVNPGQLIMPNLIDSWRHLEHQP